MVLDFLTYTVEISTDTDATMTDSHPEASDGRLYMSQQYTGKTIDDVYSMLVSCRNCLLLLCFIVFIFEAHKLLKNAMKRHFKASRGKEYIWIFLEFMSMVTCCRRSVICSWLFLHWILYRILRKFCG